MDSDEEDQPEKVKGPKFPIQMYISEGNKYLRLAKYDTALQFFDSALEAMPNNAESLIGRAKCKMRLGKISEAKIDAEEALKANPKSCEAKMLIGEADYSLGDFEKAFLTFFRGHLIRQNYDGLRLGHQMCRKAIDNALQPDESMIIDDQDEASLLSLGDQQVKKHVSKLEAGYGFYNEIRFLDVLRADDAIKYVHPHCEDLKMFLKNRQSFWRTQNPHTKKRSAALTDSTEAISSKKSDRQALKEVSKKDFTPESSLIEADETSSSPERLGDSKVKTEELSRVWFNILFKTPDLPSSSSPSEYDSSSKRE